MTKYTDAPSTTTPHDTRKLDESTGNLYESLVILSKRSNQIASEMKNELHGKLEEFATDGDNLEEVFENREQIEISKYYESLPKPTLLAVQELLEGKIYFRNPSPDATK